MTLNYSLKDSRVSFPEWKVLRCGGYSLVSDLPFSADWMCVVLYVGASDTAPWQVEQKSDAELPSPKAKYPSSGSKGVTGEHKERWL